MSTAPSMAQPPRSGWHATEWLCEGVGTMLLLLGGVSAVCLDFGRGSWVAAHVPSVPLRLLITGALFAGSGSLVAISPLGRRSGAHLNPAVTLAFRVTGHVHAHDLAGYWCAQLLGGIAGTALAALAWGDAARSVGFGATRPGSGVSAVTAFAVELAMTAVLVGVILAFVSSRRLMQWTPLATWVTVSVLVWQFAHLTGTSLNPARSTGPAVIALDAGDLWVYLVAPLLGAVAMALGSRLVPRWRPLTARLFHDSSYPSTLGTDMPVDLTRGG